MRRRTAQFYVGCGYPGIDKSISNSFDEPIGAAYINMTRRDSGQGRLRWLQHQAGAPGRNHRGGGSRVVTAMKVKSGRAASSSSNSA